MPLSSHPSGARAMFKKAFGTVLLLAPGVSSFAGSLSGSVTASGQRDNADAVVFVDQVQGKTFPAPAAHATVDQLKMTFIPHVLVVLAGTTVDFANSDSVTHNVFTPEKCAGSFNLGTWGKGASRSHLF